MTLTIARVMIADPNATFSEKLMFAKETARRERELDKTTVPNKGH